MSEFQKVIKYIAMAFAAALAFTILSGIVTAILAVTGLLSHNPGKGSIDVNKSFSDVKSLYIENGVGTLNIKQGDGNEILVEAQNVTSDFVVDKSFSGELKIESKFNFWNIFSGKGGAGEKSKITVYVPADFVADRMKLDAGAGNIEIEDLEAEKLDINAGAGNINGSRITAEQVVLDGAVGNITLDQVNFTDSDIDCGVGNVKIQGSLYGKNKIDCGVGDVTLDLLQSSDDFNLKVEKGLGSVRINGEKYSDLNLNSKTADNSLKIDGGVGNIDVNFNK
jgi:DUF4097 and DUF4098 domain-containing protein YvlB